MEKTILVKVSEELHRAIKVKASQEGLSIKDFVTKALEQAIDQAAGPESRGE